MLEPFQSLPPLQELDPPSTVNQTMKKRGTGAEGRQARGISACSRLVGLPEGGFICSPTSFFSRSSGVRPPQRDELSASRAAVRNEGGRGRIIFPSPFLLPSPRRSKNF